ncbi:TCPE [Hepatospora eriocheir]|uniref:TCPE n=1 Tax=Hepatospora eriocheir TaxID=1081669 RepID=A0A1X0Q9X9_9MICR|nr:TCPE [Hepatospora eriocheir]
MQGGKFITDEFGLSFEINSDTNEIRGVNCVEVNYKAIEKISDIIESSLGPNGRDKIIVDQDERITVTNDGRTILENFISAENVTSPALVLAKELSESQDNEIGDGTTSLVLIAKELLKNSLDLMKVKIHPVRIAEGNVKALNYVLEYMKTELCESIEKEKLRYACLEAAKTSLNSKVAGYFEGLPEICVNALFNICGERDGSIDLEKINIKLIKGGLMNQTELVNGVVIEKEMVISKKMMEQFTVNKECKIALLACPFEPPKLKNTGNIIISNCEEYMNLSSYERDTFLEMIRLVKESGADLVLCQWGFDDEATSMLLENDLPAVRWVPGHELGYLGSLLNGKIVSRFEDLSSDSLGVCNVRLSEVGTDNTKFIYFTNKEVNNTTSTIIVRCANKFVGAEIERSITDALCAARNVMVESKIIYGGGSTELSIYCAINNFKRDKNHILNLLEPVDCSCFKMFAESLLVIPEVLAKNSGHPTDYVEKIIDAIVTNNLKNVGIDCFEGNEYAEMDKMRVFESFKSKASQYKMAVDFVNSILKINEAIRK